jgi:hypothetical protein
MRLETKFLRLQLNCQRLAGVRTSSNGKRFLMPVSAGTQGETPPLTVVVNWLAWVKK